MKRLGSSDSLGALMTICPSTSTEEHSPRRNNTSRGVYGRELQSMLDGLDEDGCVEELGHPMEKKRRLSVDQVKALEKNFEVENKLEPERKVKLAQELGLQPRQVAVWFQNRRARWKTKQLERDYGVLKANYDALKLNYDALHQDNEALLREIKELKSRLQEEKSEDVSVKEEIITQPAELCDDKVMGIGMGVTLVEEASDIPEGESPEDMNYECFNRNDAVGGASLFSSDQFNKDGASDSDSSAILNEGNSPNAGISSPGVLQSHHHHQQMIMSPPPPPPPAVSSSLKFNTCSSSSMNCFQFQKTYQTQPQYVKMEEHNFFSADEACNFFSDEQAPTLQWYWS